MTHAVEEKIGFRQINVECYKIHKDRSSGGFDITDNLRWHGAAC